MTPQKILSVFETYLKTPGTAYALMINGTWGCGKTHFWKTEMASSAEINSYKSLYVSLNGINNIDDLKQSILTKMIPLLNSDKSGWVKKIENSTSAIFAYAKKNNVAGLIQGVATDIIDFKKYVICFDDLERCQLPFKVVLGFINDYVEHKNLKTIILADETKIDCSNADYASIKEKVIGRVFNFKLVVDQILPQLLNVYQTTNPEYFQWLSEWLITLVALLKEYKQNNLRTIKFFLETLEKLHQKINHVDKKYQKEIIVFALTICIEFKTGNIQSNETNDYKGLDDFSNNYYAKILHDAMDRRANKEITRVKEYPELFFENYLLDRKNDFFFYPSVFRYILSGFLEHDLLEKELKNREPEILPVNRMAFNKLINYNFRELESEEFNSLISSVQNFAKNGEYTLYDYSLIAEFYFMFSKNKLANITYDQIKEFIKEGIDKAALRKEINDNLLDNLLHWAPHDIAVNEIREEIKLAHNNIKKETFVSEGSKLSLAIRNGNIEDLRRIFEQNFLVSELFQFITVAELANAIDKAPNVSLMELEKLIYKRYNSTNIGEFLSDEIDVLIELESKVESMASDCNGQPRKFVLSTLLETIIDRRKHTEATKKITAT